MIRPVFLLSLPRSGSTLLQRLIATHPAIATASEPWFLLPLFLAFRDGHVFTDYQQRLLAPAFEDFLAQLGGTEAHYAAVRRFAESLYERACQPHQSYFLDKTPRYHLVAQDLASCFPDARFILLWRHPLAVAASMLDHQGGRWSLHAHRVDLFHGFQNLLEFQGRNDERIFCLRYEDLVEDPDHHLEMIFRHLDLTPVASPSRHYQEVKLEGRMGDKKGERVYSEVSRASRDGWAAAFSTLPRRYWARRYLRFLGRERLETAGYDLDATLAEIKKTPLTWRRMASDLVRMSLGRSAIIFEHNLFRKKRALAKSRLDVPHD